MRMPRIQGSESRRLVLVLPLLVVAIVVVIYLFGRDQVAETVEIAPPAAQLPDRDRLETVTLYFGAVDHVGLVAEPRSLTTGGSLEDRLQACIRELARGSFEEHLDVVPETTQLRRAYLDPWGAAYLDFSRDLLGTGPLGDGQEWLTVAAIVRTVCDSYPQVREVRFLIEGQMVVSLGGYIDLEEALRASDFPDLRADAS